MKTYNIRSNRDYELFTILLRDLLSRDRSAERDERIVELKRSLRAWSHRPLFEHSDRGLRWTSSFAYSYDDVGYVEKITLPEQIETEEEAKEFMEGMIWIEPYYTYYDCTGRPFSNWYKVFRRGGHWMAYHSVSYDV